MMCLQNKTNIIRNHRITLIIIMYLIYLCGYVQYHTITHMHDPFFGETYVNLSCVNRTKLEQVQILGLIHIQICRTNLEIKQIQNRNN